MTALCGLVRMHGADAGLPAMLNALANYGPQSWRWRGAAVALGAAGAPDAAPLAHGRAGNRRMTIVADARLDNPAELRDALGLRPKDGAATAAALILRAYLRWGPACADRLYGDFAFVVWDAPRQRLFCARDALGTRPFYYALNAQRFAFASDVWGVLAAPGVGAELDELRVAAHLGSLSPVFLRRTFFQGVLRLAPGHTLTVDAGRIRPVRQRPYWRPESLPEAPAASLEAHSEALLEQLERAVRVRLGDAPVGLELSGGLDSSTVGVLAARELRRRGLAPPPAFCWQPPPCSPLPPEHAKEYERIRAVAAQEDLQVHYCAPSPDDLLRVFRRDVCLPQGNESPMLSKAAGEGVRVILSGLGGDEGVSYGGRGHYPLLLLSGRWPSYLAHVRAHGLRLVPYTLGTMVTALNPHLMNYLLRTRARLERGRTWRFALLGDRRGRWLIDPEFARRVPPPSTTMRHIGVRRSQLRWLRLGHLSSRMESEAANSVHWGLEFRYPLLDRRLVELALKLPPEMFCGPPSRFLMRRAVGRLLPSEVLTAEKVEYAIAAAHDDTLAAALPAIRRAVLAPEAPLARAAYIDLPRLLESLDPEKFRSRPNPVPMGRALTFLDF